MTAQFQIEFHNIKSESDLAAFTAKYSLHKILEEGASATYVGSLGDQTGEVRERWWDPSSVYAAHRDEHEAVLVIGSKESGRVRFTGNS